MACNREQVQKLKEHVIALSNGRKEFIHHQWFVEFHLLVVEQISLELCKLYKSANLDVVLTMVWLHDYGKILDFSNQHSTTLSEGKNCLLKLGFEESFATEVVNYIDLLDRKENLDAESVPIEVKIVSSADGASHLVGPFFSLWWYENPQKSFRELMQDNVAKAEKDWNKKMVLPEVRKAFAERREYFLEQTGRIPERFFPF
jgi:hypothetical protein